MLRCSQLAPPGVKKSDWPALNGTSERSSSQLLSFIASTSPFFPLCPCCICEINPANWWKHSAWRVRIHGRFTLAEIQIVTFLLFVRVQGCGSIMTSGRRTALLSTPTQSSSWRKLWPPKKITRRYLAPPHPPAFSPSIFATPSSLYPPLLPLRFFFLSLTHFQRIHSDK